MNEARKYIDATGILLLVLFCASWGVNQVAIKVAIPSVPPVLQAGIRSIGAFICLLLWMHWKKETYWKKDGTLVWGLLVGVLFSLEFILIYWGLEYTTASRSAIFLYTSPFTVALGAHFFIPGDRLGIRQVSGLILAFLGIIAAFHESMSLPTPQMLIGDAMLLAGGVIWGATTVIIKASPLSKISATKTLLYQLGVSAIMLPVSSMCLGEPGMNTLTWISFSSLVYQIVWVAFITYIGWFWLIRTYPVSKISSFSFLTPLFGVVAGAVLLGEPLTWSLACALALVGSGIYLVNQKR